MSNEKKIGIRLFGLGKKKKKDSVPIKTQLQNIDASIKKVYSQFMKLHKKQKNEHSFIAVPELIVRMDNLKREKYNLILSYVSPKRIPVDYFVEKKKNLEKFKIPDRFVKTDSKNRITDLNTRKPIGSATSKITQSNSSFSTLLWLEPKLQKIGLSLSEDCKNLEVVDQDKYKLSKICDELYFRWLDSEDDKNDLKNEDYEIFDHLLNNSDAINKKVPESVRCAIGRQIYKKMSVKKTAESIKKVENFDLRKIYIREFINFFVEHQTKHDISIPYHKKGKRKKEMLKDLTEVESPIVELIRREVINAMREELIAFRQYFIDANSWSMTRLEENWIKRELEVHAKEEEGHYNLLSELFTYSKNLPSEEELSIEKVPGPSETTNLKILRKILQDERKAVFEYEQILLKLGKQNKETAVYDIISYILEDEKDHVVETIKFIKVVKGNMTIKEATEKNKQSSKETLFRQVPVKMDRIKQIDDLNLMLRLNCDLVNNPAYLFRANQKVTRDTKSTVPFIDYSIINGVVNGEDFEENMEKIVKKSKAIVFVPIMSDESMRKGKFNVRPGLISYNELVNDVLKKFKKLILLIVQHSCLGSKSFNITYVINPLEYPEKIELRSQIPNDFFINSFRSNFDWHVKTKESYGIAIQMLNDAFFKSRDNQVTCFHVLKSALSSFVKRILYGTLKKSELILKGGNVVINRVVYCSSLLTILESHFNYPFLDFEIVRKFLYMIKNVMVNHLMLVVPNIAKIEKFEKTKMKEEEEKKKPGEFFKMFTLIKRMIKGPDFFIKKTPTLKLIKNRQVELIYILKALEDPFISIMFNVDCFFNQKEGVDQQREFNKFTKWEWSYLQKFIREKGYLKRTGYIDIKSLTQKSFDDNRIPDDEKPIERVFGKYKLLDNLNICKIINKCTFADVLISDMSEEMVKNVKKSKKESFRKQKQLLKIDNTFVAIYPTPLNQEPIKSSIEECDEKMICLDMLKKIKNRLIGENIVQNTESKKKLKEVCESLLDGDPEIHKECKEILSTIDK